MYAATGEPNVKWGATISNGGPGTTGSPAGDGPVISSYQVVDASFQSPLVGPCIHTHLAYNVISAYLIVW